MGLWAWVLCKYCAVLSEGLGVYIWGSWSSPLLIPREDCTASQEVVKVETQAKH